MFSKVSYVLFLRIIDHLQRQPDNSDHTGEKPDDTLQLLADGDKLRLQLVQLQSNFIQVIISLSHLLHLPSSS